MSIGVYSNGCTASQATQSCSVLYRPLFALLFLFIALPAAIAFQDRTIPVTDGLVIYFDASAEDTAMVGRWRNSHGRELTLEAANESVAPKRIQVGKGWVIRFDGQDDSLRVTGTGLGLTDATLFVVAAPHDNPGDFRGLLAGNAPDQRDYESGFNLDLGPGPTAAFDQVNIEGHGFQGAQNLRQKNEPFGQLHLLEVAVDAIQKKVSLTVDGKAEGVRASQGQSFSMEEITVGGRFFTNGPGQHQIRGPFSGDIAAILIFDRLLTADETIRVRQFLTDQYLTLNDALKATLPARLSLGVPLIKVPTPPDVQMLMPGFQVDELPVKLTNVDNVRYRRDGKLVTLGYNGDIHLLSDTDNDGLEDTAHLFWKNKGSIRGPIGMVLTPPDYPRGQGVIVASKGKISMIVDRDGDDQGDEELIVASGWEEIPQNVDAVGLAMAPDGSLYFGLGTANYANAYLVDESGQAKYDLNSQRGTVQRVSADWSQRDTVCTGIRFPIAFDFNEHGDLFCTEQEGATWLPNGNPFDELLHIALDGQAPQANPTGKRHFGFPPRHPRHNPSVIDEPSVFDYGPQHQSTCGMVFNTSINGGPVFGPNNWRNNALVCGESRGKIWRTQLVKTDSGYVAASQLIACLQMLTVDACVTPRGEMVIACHSGPPDWGTGPEGIGKLFRVKMTAAQAARPVAAWMSSPSEFQIAFDQPLDVESVRGLASRTAIQYGAYVRAGDRFENLVPPYAVVRQQQLQPRFELPVHSAALSPDARTLTIHTAVISQSVNHSITLPLATGDVDIDAQPTGVLATWTAAGDTAPTWQGYLPHIDLAVCRDLLVGSATHAQLFDFLQQPGTLQLRTKLNYRDMLRPAVQAGASIDYQWPDEQVSLRVQSNAEDLLLQSLRSDGKAISSSTQNETVQQFELQLPTGANWTELNLSLRTGRASVPTLTINYNTSEDSTFRALPLNRFWLPFAPTDSALDNTQGSNSVDSIPELAGGNWGRGRRLFDDQRAMCGRCHAVGGDGAKIGPDLGNLVFRDYASVLRDIREPSRAINPDYLTHLVSVNDGRVLTGVVSSDGDHLVIANSQGETTRILRDEVEQMQPTGVSVMPVELLNKLNASEQRDLLTYLLTPAPRMPLESKLPAPPVRTRAEVAAALAGSSELPADLKPLKIILVDGVKDHGPGEHDYPAWQHAWAQLLAAAPNVDVATAREFPDDAQLATSDIVIFFQKGSFSTQRALLLDRFLKRGGGAVFIHWAVNGDDRVQDFAQRIGFASWGGRIAYRHGPLQLDVTSSDHPIMRNFKRLDLYDESYWKLTGNPSEVTVLATSVEDNESTPQIWIRDHQPGRVFVSIPGHYSWTFDDPLFRILLLRGIAWTADQPLDRFNDLVTPGARMSN